MNHRSASVSLLIALAACRSPEPAGEPMAATETHAIVVDGTPEAVGLLGFLNAPETTFAVLDIDVALDRRAAENLIAHRDGPDAVHATGDDDPFDDVAEVDAVPQVGPATLAKLVAYAEANGYVPSGGDLLGVFDNVAFTVDEATATLDFVNTAAYALLDVDAALDKRAVDAIFAARPIASVLALSLLHYVGPSAMLKLRDFPKTLGGKAIGDECSAHGECQSGLCGALTLWEQGWCLEPWQASTFESQATVAIPDGGPAVTSPIEVDGLASVPLDVVVTLDIDHPRPQDLVVGLHQPGNAYALLWNHQADPPSTITSPSGIEGDNMVNGTWVLEIVDTVTGESGTLNGWSMWISSNWD